LRAALKTKLVASYAAMAVFLVASLLAVSNYYIDKQFQIYVAHRQDMKNAEIVGAVSDKFAGSSDKPDAGFTGFIERFGDSLLREGVTLMIYDASGAMMYCSSDDDVGCVHTGAAAVDALGGDCPEFNGAYSTESFAIERGGVPLGSIKLGYHHQFPYDEGGVNFISAFNRAFFATSALFFAAAIGIGLVMAGMIAGPIKRVTDRTRVIAEGNFSGEHITTGTAEIDELSASVDHLADRLRTQFMLKKRMASAYSHEFRTPLAVLQGNIEAMIDGIWTPTKDRLESLLAEILRMSRMVSDVDDLVRIGNPEARLVRESIDLADMAARVLRGYETRAAAKGIRLRLDAERAEANVDPDKFSQVMVNLISNAVKYTDGGGLITVRARATEGGAVFEVIDDGIGISEADVPYIFEHMYRTDESRGRDSGGNGVGLSVARAIVDAHGGTITVKSRPGEGSAFTVTIPADAR
jgi:signal transduction histidine kinase